MDNDINTAKTNAKAVIIAAVIGGLCTIIAAVMGSVLIKDYEELQSENSELITEKNLLQETYQNSQNEYNDLNKNYIALQNNFEALENDYDALLSQNDDNNQDDETITEKDQIEIDEILETLSLYQNKDDTREYFEHLSEDVNEIELLYKLYLSTEYYKYSNLIAAFNEYGIDCENLLITESSLACWDIQILYIHYQIENHAENSEDKIYCLDDYKMEYIYKCNYMGFQFTYTDKTYDDISRTINERINRMLRKMERNSLPIT